MSIAASPSDYDRGSGFHCHSPAVDRVSRVCGRVRANDYAEYIRSPRNESSQLHATGARVSL